MERERLTQGRPKTRANHPLLIKREKQEEFRLSRSLRLEAMSSPEITFVSSEMYPTTDAHSITLSLGSSSSKEGPEDEVSVSRLEIVLATREDKSGTTMSVREVEVIESTPMK